MARLHPYRLLACFLVLAALSSPLFPGQPAPARRPAPVRPSVERSLLRLAWEWLGGDWDRDLCSEEGRGFCRVLASPQPEAIDGGCIIDPHGNVLCTP